MSPPLEVLLDADVSECGDVLTGMVTYKIDGGPGSVSVSLVSELQTAERAETTVAADFVVDVAAGPAPFALSVPSAGPITFKTPLAQLEWRVEARVVGPEHDDSAAVALTVLPAGGLALWARKAAGPPSMPTTLR